MGGPGIICMCPPMGGRMPGPGKQTVGSLVRIQALAFLTCITVQVGNISSKMGIAMSLSLF